MRMKGDTMNKIIIWIAMLGLLGFMFLPSKAHAADTSDVIAGIIFGGLLGAEIEKGKQEREEYSHIILPNGTLVVPVQPRKRYRSRDEMCFYVLDEDGLPKYATPECFDVTKHRNSFMDYRLRRQNYMSQEDLYRRNFPCGDAGGYGCRNYLEKLK